MFTPMKMEENAWENNHTVKVRRDDVILFIDRNNSVSDRYRCIDH